MLGTSPYSISFPRLTSAHPQWSVKGGESELTGQHSEVTFNVLFMKVTMENIRVSGLLHELYFSFKNFSFGMQKFNV